MIASAAANAFPLLSAVTFLPLLGGIAALPLKDRPDLCRILCLLVALADLALVALLPCYGDLFGALAGGGGAVLAEDFAWIPRFGIRYTLALDGLSYLLVVMTAFLGVLAVLVSWREITRRTASYHAFLLFTQTSAMGVFLARDLFLFYLFWEVQLVPMFFLIGIWGHERRREAALKFFLFSIAGGLFMLLAVIGLYLAHGAQTGDYTFALPALLASPATGAAGAWLFAAFLLAFAIKMPIVPVHTWLPDAHTQAPTAGSLILAGVLLKTGAYALVRWAFPLFPQASAASATLLVVLGVGGLFYVSWIALAQTDVKRLIAYSSIGHMGLIVLGVAVWDRISLAGSVLQMVNHALTTGALFIMVGMLAERTDSREMSDFGGLWKRMPVFSAFFLLFCLASAGLPGLGNFVSELLILVGSYQVRPVAAVFAFAGMVFTLVYVLRLVQGTLFGEPGGRSAALAALPDLSARETAILVPLALSTLYLGLAPSGALELLHGPIGGLLGLR
ncbi:proton-translocating NADH-quinone oxidoreductase, chain M [Desulfovibrio sp. X2]|uniref:complex I subunit 4 family protein n=1 Tax=Desulfovibrio sp. X2 TaxID=941449 RepID=UPI000358B82E|nr:NADH-quinone oxidoreductase subunit M [Desulfovibrio sp. X2]EPR43568.1 proton-translocating NADH-quinone oxidoreductase, chain M [Desulfovibrio sp. X2]